MCIICIKRRGTDFSGATHQYLSNERQLQVGPVDLPAERTDGMRNGTMVIFVLRGANHLYQKVFSLLCALNACVHTDLLPAFCCSLLSSTPAPVCIIHLKMCILLFMLHASVRTGTFIHMFAYVLNALEHCSPPVPLLASPLTFCPVNIRGGLGLTNHYLLHQPLTPKVLRWSESGP